MLKVEYNRSLSAVVGMNSVDVCWHRMDDIDARFLTNLDSSPITCIIASYRIGTSEEGIEHRRITVKNMLIDCVGQRVEVVFS